MGDERATRPRVILLPGLGADPRMFAAQRAAIPDLETPAWIPHVDRESLRDYAARMARTLNIQEPAILGGVSLGGMIALEMVRLVPTRCVILIGSCCGRHGVSRLLRAAERFSRWAPDILLDKSRVLAPIFLGRGGRLAKDQRALLAQMARDLPVSFLRWAARAAVEWDGCGDSGVPVHHIHGARDWVMPAARLKPDVVVPGGLHVLNMSHPSEVNAFIAAACGVDAKRAVTALRSSPARSPD